MAAQAAVWLCSKHYLEMKTAESWGMAQQGAKGSVLNKALEHKKCFASIGNRIPRFCIFAPASHLNTSITFLRQDDNTDSVAQCPTFSKLCTASLPQVAGNMGFYQNTTEISKNLLIHLIRVQCMFAEQHENTWCERHLSYCIAY